MAASLFDDVRGDAIFSPCRTYRYLLWRHWSDGDRFINFLMLNPSTADEAVNDPTVERCQRRAKRLGFDGLYVTNLFALRSTDPAMLYTHPEPVGLDNDQHILETASDSEIVVCAWGAHGQHAERLVQVRRKLLLAGFGGKLLCLGLTKYGHPRHPLYVPYAEPLKEFWRAAE